MLQKVINGWQIDKFNEWQLLAKRHEPNKRDPSPEQSHEKNHQIRTY